MPQWLTMFEGRLEIQPPLSDEQLAHVPAKRGNVMLLGEGDAPIVLLSAADMRGRLRARLAERPADERRKTADLREITRSIVWRVAWGHFETDLHYLELARAIWPQDYSQMLSWRRPWFVHVDPQEKFPHFVRTHDVLAGRGLYLGPLPDGASAQKLVAVIEDVFGLCRDIRCLRLAPQGPPCPYSQMGKCVSVCDGKIPLQDYRGLIAQAADWIAHRRGELAQSLQSQMKESAQSLKFEQAGAIKAKLARLAELDKPAYEQARPAQQFGFLLVQSGPSTREARVFFADRGDVLAGEPLAFPPGPQQVQAMLATMSSLCARQIDCPPPDATLRQWRMGLVASYLFSSPAKRGLVLPWREDMTVDAVTEAINAAAEDLGLKAPKPRRKDGSQSKESSQ